MQDDWDSDYDSDCSSTSSSESSFDEEEVNQRVSPYWPKYRTLIFSRGFRLDTVRDVKEFYNECHRQGQPLSVIPPGIDTDMGEEALCPDQGLVSPSISPSTLDTHSIIVCELAYKPFSGNPSV